MRALTKEVSCGAWLMMSCKSLIAVVDYIYGAVYVILMNERGLNAFEISTVFAVSTMLLFLFDFPTGAISDKYGRKKVAGIGIIVWGLSFFFFLRAYSLLDFLVAQAVLQAGIALVSGNFQTWFFDLTEKYEEASFRDAFLMKVGVVVQIFSIVGSLLGAMILVVGIDTLYVGCAILMIATGILCVLIGEDNHSAQGEGKNLITHFLAVTKEFVRSPVAHRIIPFEFVMAFSTYAFILGWQLYVLNVLHIPKYQIGAILVGFMVALRAGRPLGVLPKKRQWTLEAMIVFACVIMAAGFAVLFLIPRFAFFLTGAILVELGLGLYYSAQEIWLLTKIPSQNKASFFSGLKTLEEIFIFGLSLCIGAIAQWIGLRYLWLVALVLMMAGWGYFRLVLYSKPPTVQRQTNGLDI